jgi:hypothetical protein
MDVILWRQWSPVTLNVIYLVVVGGRGGNGNVNVVTAE